MGRVRELPDRSSGHSVGARHKVELGHLECQQNRQDRSAARHVATRLNDRDVADTVNSGVAVDRPQLLH